MKISPARIGAAALLSALCAVTALPAAANIITNGDFEAGNTGFSSDHILGAVSTNANYYGIGTSLSAVSSFSQSWGDHTSGTGNAMFVNGSTSATTVTWSQTVSVLPNTEYLFSVWNANWYVPGALQLQIDGVNVGDSFSALPNTAATPLGTWSETTRLWTSGLGTSAIVSLINVSTGYSGNDFAIDDISMTAQTAAVPLPASALLLLSGLAGFIGVKRRKRAC